MILRLNLSPINHLDIISSNLQIMHFIYIKLLLIKNPHLIENNFLCCKPIN